MAPEPVTDGPGREPGPGARARKTRRSEEHTSELQSHVKIVCRLLLEKKKNIIMGVVELLLSRRNWRQTSRPSISGSILFFFFNDTATTEIYTLSLHDALPI